MRPAAVVLVALVVGFVFLGACKRAPLQIELGTAGHARGYNTDAGGSSVSDGVACFMQVEAICTLSARCRSLPEVAQGCLQLAADCPSAFLIEGSTRSNAGLVQCAADYAEFACEQFLRGEAPACATRGERKTGEACQGHMACESLFCARDASGQRTCYALAPSGGPCPARTMCPDGEQCLDGACEAVGVPSLDSGNAPQSAAGEACYETSFCQQGLYCKLEAPGEVGSCQPRPSAGQPCAAERAYSSIASHFELCDLDSYCSHDGACVSLPELSEPCAQRRDGSEPRCTLGTTCDVNTDTCQPWKAAGQACTLPRAFSSLTGLPLNPECDLQAGARCLCETDEPCEAPLCRIATRPGEACDAPFARCLYGSRCTQGVCDYPQSVAPSGSTAAPGRQTATEEP